LTGLLKKAEAAGTDLAIIDTAPHTNRDPPAVAQLADFVLIPARPAFFDLKAMAATVIALHVTKTPRGCDQCRAARLSLGGRGARQSLVA
jgi:chromosome partitioning protein